MLLLGGAPCSRRRGTPCESVHTHASLAKLTSFTHRAGTCRWRTRSSWASGRSTTQRRATRPLAARPAVRWGDVDVDSVEMALSVGVLDALWSPGKHRGLISRLRQWPFTSCSLPRHGRWVDQGPGRDGRRAPLQGDWRGCGCALGFWLERRGLQSPYRLLMPVAMIGFLDVFEAAESCKHPRLLPFHYSAVLPGPSGPLEHVGGPPGRVITTVKCCACSARQSHDERVTD